MVWTQWSLDRVIILLVGVAYLLLWIQVTLSHYRQNFHKNNVESCHPVSSYQSCLHSVHADQPSWLVYGFAYHPLAWCPSRANWLWFSPEWCA